MRLVRYRWCPLPTAIGWALLLLAAALVVIVWARTVHAFLAPDDPVPARLLVVEGWLPDHAIARAVDLYRDGGYEWIAVTGGPLERGARFSQHATHAEFGAAVAIAFGAPAGSVHAVPAPAAARYRTYASARALDEWLRARGQEPVGLNLVTLGPHARRSRLLFRRALPAGTPIGVIAIPHDGYEAHRWWTSSAGVRTVLGEWIAYLHARLQPRPTEPQVEVMSPDGAAFRGHR